MTELDPLEVLRALVEAHDQPDPRTNAREPIWYFKTMQGASVKHHGFGDSPPGDVDEALLMELHGQGLLDIDYSLQGDLKLTPSPDGRRVVAEKRRVESLEPSADVAGIVDAVAEQAEATNKLAWPAVRPVLLALRDYWEAGGFSPYGIQVPALVNALPDENQSLFAATLRALVAGDYLRPTTSLGALDLPAEVELTERAHTVLDGWPGAAPTELVENLLAVLAAEEAAETDPVRKNRLKALAKTVKDLGVNTAGEVLAKVLVGA